MRVFLLIIITVMISACGSSVPFAFRNDSSLSASLKGYIPSYPDAGIIVFSDPHFYDPELGTNGKAFQLYLSNDRKLLHLSREILDQTLSDIISMPGEIVLVPGDLTKDGEKHNHGKFALYLNKLREAGKKVFVICGNHDLRNGHAVRFTENGYEHIQSVTAEEFADIYSDFGYKAAFSRDKSSLSYAAELKPGLILLAIDSCKYEQNRTNEEPITSGAVKESTLLWAESVLKKARDNGQAVIAMSHHGVVPHYTAQKKYYGQYVMDNHDEFSSLLLAYGVRIALTGHFHAQDITMQKTGNTGGPFLMDVETGSLVTWPCPIRTIQFISNKAFFDYRHIGRTASHPSGFKDYARKYLIDGLNHLAAEALMGYGVSEKDSLFIAPQVSEAFAAHYHGDEKPRGPVLNKEGLGFLGGVLIGMREELVYSLWKDLPPADNRLTVDMADGRTE